MMVLIKEQSNRTSHLWVLLRKTLYYKYYFYYRHKFYLTMHLKDFLSWYQTKMSTYFWNCWLSWRNIMTGCWYAVNMPMFPLIVRVKRIILTRWSRKVSLRLLAVSFFFFLGSVQFPLVKYSNIPAVTNSWINSKKYSCKGVVILSNFVGQSVVVMTNFLSAP